MAYVKDFTSVVYTVTRSVYRYLKTSNLARNVIAGVAASMLLVFLSLNDPRLYAVSEWTGSKTSLEEGNATTAVGGIRFKIEIFNWGFQSGGIKEAKIDVRRNLDRDVDIRTVYVDRDAIRPFDKKEITVWVKAVFDADLKRIKWDVTLYDLDGDVVDSNTFAFKNTDIGS